MTNNINITMNKEEEKKDTLKEEEKDSISADEEAEAPKKEENTDDTVSDSVQDENDDKDDEEENEENEDDENEDGEEEDESDDEERVEADEDDDEDEGDDEDEDDEDEDTETSEEDEDEKDNGAGEKKNPILILVFIVLVATIIFLIWQKVDNRSEGGQNQTASVLGSVTTYNNPVHGFSIEYPEAFRLIATGNIPEDMVAQGIESMEMLGLSDGDALLIDEEKVNNDNIIYTILALSNQPSFTTLPEYMEELRTTLDQSGEEFNFSYDEREVTVGKQAIDAAEFSFEMDVPSGDGTIMRQGAFFDTIFEYNDTAFSISFGYPKDIEDSEKYVDAYRTILASIDFDVVEEGTAAE